VSSECARKAPSGEAMTQIRVEASQKNHIREKYKRTGRRLKENVERVDHKNTRYIKRTRKWKTNAHVLTQPGYRVGSVGEDTSLPSTVLPCKECPPTPADGKASRYGQPLNCPSRRQ
jgi:hypothetical protein